MLFHTGNRECTTSLGCPVAEGRGGGGGRGEGRGRENMSDVRGWGTHHQYQTDPKNLKRNMISFA